MKDRGSTSKLSALRTITRESSVFHNTLRNKQVEFKPYIYTLSKLSRSGNEIFVFNTEQGGIQNNHRPIRNGNGIIEE